MGERTGSPCKSHNTNVGADLRACPHFARINSHDKVPVIQTTLKIIFPLEPCYSEPTAEESTRLMDASSVQHDKVPDGCFTPFSMTKFLMDASLRSA
ncbi:hypothetical protein Ctha_2631 [Chloroherpeton thalassium ATCC 35110]|uniref:Uncharacterized protein n=1 Tax=Chloroherpeton thalassium (strain ATCC 35110 / GB-78) TaxID=517418 RepID=B3QYB4_CHLT3|nr:hypothetical protein Ctha_2631 [Chloroherpeton thalassium ATCC 35110]